MATVTVRGTATVSGVPDDALVWLTVASTRAGPEEAYDEVARRSEELETVLGELGIAREARTTSGVTLHEQYEHGADGRRHHRGYRASSKLTVRVADQAVLGRLLRETVSRAEAHVDGPAWRVAPDNPLRSDARREAALDARRRAEAYAEALGARLGAIVAVSEPGTSPPPSPEGVFSARHEIPVDSGELDVHASVEVTFALEPA
jgi:uncharacterized protein YggE